MISSRASAAFAAVLCLAIFAPAATARADEKPKHPDLVFLLIGQSNMAGRAPLAEGDDEPIPGVFLLNGEGEWEPARNPLNRYSNNRKDLRIQRVGPGDGFVRALRDALPDKTVGLVVNARGGTSIEQWAKGKPLYDNTLKRLRAVPDVEWAGILWHQGEANARDEDYLEKLARFIAVLREDLDSPEVPFVAGQVKQSWRIVNEQIARLPKKVEHTAYAGSEGLTLFDNAHFDRKSIGILGERYAEAWLDLTGRAKK